MELGLTKGQPLLYGRPRDALPLSGRVGVVVAEDEFADHADALVWARADDGPDDEVQRVEYLGPEGDWRWAGPCPT